MTMSEFIKQDLCSRIQSGEHLPPSLTLAKLAAHYGVSFTPVRQAVRELVEQRLIEKLDNGRLVVHPQAASHPNMHRAAPPKPVDWEQVVADRVLRLSLQGDAGYLREEATARELGVGRTVVRQVFNRLAGKGLLEHIPRCGWRVRAFNEADMLAYLEVRETLEVTALNLARPRLVEADLRRMLSGNPDPDSVTEPRLDNELHRYLLVKSQNRYILDFFDRHSSFYTTLFDRAALGPSIVAEMARQHREILQALLDHDWPRASDALAHHIRSQAPVVKLLMSRLSPDSPHPLPLG